MLIRGSYFVTALMVPVAASADCNWGGGASTPQSVFARSCRQQGGVPHGCSCDAPGAGNSGNSNYADAAAQQAAAAAAAAAAVQRQHEAELQQQRIEAENKKRMEDIANQAKFIDDRNAAASTLRGADGGTASEGVDATGLRGSSGTSDGLKGTGLRGSGTTTELRSANTVPRESPNQDPMVVDARHVPSGLPKSIAAEIPETPAGDRVRKGFEAIMDHDWNAAHAWFQDALNHDPGNAGIQRLVDLADYTLKYNNRMQTQARHVETAARAKPVPLSGNPKNAQGMSVDLAKALNNYNQKFTQRPPEKIKPNWKAFFDALFVPGKRYSEVAAVRG